MIKYIFLTIIAMTQLSCGGGSGGGSFGERGKRSSVDLSSFPGRVSYSRSSAIDFLWPAGPRNPGNNLTDIFFKGSLSYSGRNITGGSLQIAFEDQFQTTERGVFAPTFRHYNPGSTLRKYGRPYVELDNNGCVRRFAAYLQDNFGTIIISGQSGNWNNGRGLGGIINFETKNGLYKPLGDFIIPYEDLFSRCTN
ncbi:MAG: hypothetical protein HAW63_01450 [Bdellovibrionaceae bacterium]|nr:hypothetical protein [Pseudobdellovibrionaceae bacterium]